MESCGKEKPSKSTFYKDGKNVYGRTMSKCIPFGRCKQLIQDQIERLDVNFIQKYSPESLRTKYLHDLHYDYPLVPEKIDIKESMPSNYWTEVLQLSIAIKVGHAKSLYTVQVINMNMFFTIETCNYICSQEKS